MIDIPSLCRAYRQNEIDKRNPMTKNRCRTCKVEINRGRVICSSCGQYAKRQAKK